MHVIQGLGATSGRSSRAPCLCTGRSRFNAWRVGRSPDESWVILPFQQDFSLWIPMINFNDPVDAGLMLDVNIPMLNSNVGCVYRVYRSSEKKSVTLPKNDLMSWKMTDLMDPYGCLESTRKHITSSHHGNPWVPHGVLNLMWLDNIIFRARASTASAFCLEDHPSPILRRRGSAKSPFFANQPLIHGST